MVRRRREVAPTKRRCRDASSSGSESSRWAASCCGCRHSMTPSSPTRTQPISSLSGTVGPRPSTSRKQSGEFATAVLHAGLGNKGVPQQSSSVDTAGLPHHGHRCDSAHVHPRAVDGGSTGRIGWRDLHGPLSLHDLLLDRSTAVHADALFDPAVLTRPAACPGQRGEFGWWVAYAACSCGAVYTHYAAAFLLIVQLAWALWTQPQVRKNLIIANVAVVLGFVPWINGFREDLHAPNYISALAPLTPHVILTILATTWIGHPFTPIDRLPGTAVAALAAVALAIAAIGLLLKARATGRLRWHPNSRTILIVLLALAPACLMLLYSAVRGDVFGGPFLIADWPGLALAIGALVCGPRRTLRFVAVTLTLGVYAVGGIMMLGSAAQRPNINAVVVYIERVGTHGDPIVASTLFAGPLSEVDVALADNGQTRDYPVLRLGSPSLAEQLAPLSGPNPQPAIGQPITPPNEVAASAVALAWHGTIFLISFSTSLYPNKSNMEAGEFLSALPARFHVVRRITFSGFSGRFHREAVRDSRHRISPLRATMGA